MRNDIPPELFCLSGMAIAFLLGYIVGRLQRMVSRNLGNQENRGEAAVRKLLTQSLDPKDNHVLNNLTIPFDDGTTQIDHILISTKGVFVIEAKYFSGWIFGKEKSAVWTQVLYRFKSKFQNPLRQNFRHVKAVQKLLDFLPPEYVHSVVVFAGSAEFKTDIPKGVCIIAKLLEHIQQYQEDVISANRVEFCVGRLECTRYRMTQQTDIEHVIYLNRKFGKV